MPLPSATPGPVKRSLGVSWCGTPRLGVSVWEESVQTPQGILCTMRDPCPSCQRLVFVVQLETRYCEFCGAASCGGRLLDDPPASLASRSAGA